MLGLSLRNRQIIDTYLQMTKKLAGSSCTTDCRNRETFDAIREPLSAGSVFIVVKYTIALGGDGSICPPHEPQSYCHPAFPPKARVYCTRA